MLGEEEDEAGAMLALQESVKSGFASSTGKKFTGHCGAGRGIVSAIWELGRSGEQRSQSLQSVVGATV